MIDVVCLHPCGHSMCLKCNTTKKEKMRDNKCHLCKVLTQSYTTNFSVKEGVEKLPAECIFCNLQE